MRRIVLTDEQKDKFERKAAAIRTNSILRELCVRRKKRVQKSICPNCNKEFYSKVAIANDHIGHCSKKCRVKRTVKMHKVKTKPSRIDFYSTPEWQRLRMWALRRYGFQCMACGNKPPNVVIHVDHIKPRSKCPHLELDPNNLQVLCADCNFGKSNIFQDDFRK